MQVTFEIYRDPKQLYRWRLVKLDTGVTLAESASGFPHVVVCEASIDLVKTIGRSTPIRYLAGSEEGNPTVDPS